MRRLLIITAEYTGHGHKSISDSLQERLAVFKDREVMTIDGFDLMSNLQKVCCEKSYGPITRLPSKAWATQYAAGARFKQPLQRMIVKTIREKFYRLMEDFKPDCILSVHPIFIGCILDLLEEMKSKVPFIVHEADLIDIAVFWFDKRTYLTLAPSKEAYDCTVANGIDPEKVRVVGFPVRSRFMGLADKVAKPIGNPLTITVMSGSEGSGMIKLVTRELMRKTNAKVNVVCGRNKSLRRKLKKTFGKLYHERLNVLGFVDRIQDVMCESDLLIMRASPNSVMEAVALNKPVILFGQLAGQELHNPDMMKKHGLAEYCPDVSLIPDAIERLVCNSGEGIRKRIECQKAYAPGDTAMETAELLNEIIRPVGWDS